MDAIDRRSPALRVWSLATFHTVSFAVAAAALTHLGGSLADALGRLDTARGLLGFLVLWALTLLATRAGLRRLTPIERATTTSIVMQTTIAGGWNGASIFAALVAFGLISGFATRGAAAASFIPLQVFAAVVGSVLAFAVGAIVGLVYGLIDSLLIGCGSALHEWSRAAPAKTP